MAMSKELTDFVQYIQKAQNEFNSHRQGAFDLGCNSETLESFDKLISLTSSLENKAKQGELKINYLNQFQSNIESILSILPFRGQPNSSFLAHQNEHYKSQIKNSLEQNNTSIPC